MVNEQGCSKLPRNMTTQEIRDRLLLLGTSAMKSLAQEAGVSERGLWKIRGGKTKTASESIKEKIEPCLKKRRRIKQ